MIHVTMETPTVKPACNHGTQTVQPYPDVYQAVHTMYM